MKTATFTYHLPQEQIAQTPITPRDASRLMMMNRQTGSLTHQTFRDLIDFLQPGDVLVGNNSRVIPARLFGKKATGGKVELLLLERVEAGRWRALAGGKRLNVGTLMALNDKQGNASALTGTITAVLQGAQREVQFSKPLTDEILASLGHTPLPPYISARLSDEERYQTIYGRPAGSAAAPTAGLHFTSDLLLALRKKGVLFETVTLHVGLDTFKPVSAADVADHPIHSEWATLTPAAAKRINDAKLAGGRLIAIGTTTMRVLETAALRSAGLIGSLQNISAQDAAGETTSFCPWKPVAAFEGATDLFIYPGYLFRAVDGLITNFHLPQSSLLMLVSAFSSWAHIKRAYETAVFQKYRFFSFGDAMFITNQE